jgi:hypothetical protein
MRRSWGWEGVDDEPPGELPVSGGGDGRRGALQMPGICAIRGAGASQLPFLEVGDGGELEPGRAPDGGRGRPR